jgi:hypothetical protein
MTRNHWMLLGFFMAIVGMLLFAVAPLPARALVWCGTAFAWLGIAAAVESKPWHRSSKRLLQTIIGAAALAIAMSATKFSLAGVAISALVGGVMGAFAPLWTRWISGRNHQ